MSEFKYDRQTVLGLAGQLHTYSLLAARAVQGSVDRALSTPRKQWDGPTRIKFNAGAHEMLTEFRVAVLEVNRLSQWIGAAAKEISQGEDENAAEISSVGSSPDQPSSIRTALNPTS
jgi:hypothetical protein